MIIEATAIARKLNADLVVFRAPDGVYRVVDTAEETVVANATPLGRDLLVKGASCRGLNVYDFDAKQFLCGTLGQLVGEIK